MSTVNSSFSRLMLFLSCFLVGVTTLHVGMADEQLLEPIRPGDLAARPFWNQHAERFIYPPRFDFAPRAEARSYSYTLKSLTDGASKTFESDRPDAFLTPIWTEIQPDSLLLLVEAVTRHGQTIPVGERRLIKSTPFGGYYTDPAFGYREAAILSLDSLFRSPRIQHWLENGTPNPDYPLWVYPAKVMGAAVRAMTAYTRLADDEQNAAEARRAATIIADYMLDLRPDEGEPTAGWIPTHYRLVEPENHPVYDRETMTPFPAEAAWAMMDLYDLTADDRYLDAAIRTAEQYEKLQLDNGTWYLIVRLETGEPGRNKNLLVPSYVIELYDMLERRYGVKRFEDSRRRAFEWTMKHPVQTFHWEAQFEDTRPKPLLRNMSYREAIVLARILFRDAETNEDIQTAEEVFKYVEDQFVVWDPKDPMLFRHWFRKDVVWNAYDPETGQDWFLPCTLEQYAFYTPISGATAYVLDTAVEAYRATGNTEYLAKARQLANAITQAQAYHGGGEIPTHMRRTLPEKNWTNVGTYAALILLKNAEVLN